MLVVSFLVKPVDTSVRFFVYDVKGWRVAMADSPNGNSCTSYILHGNPYFVDPDDIRQKATELPLIEPGQSQRVTFKLECQQFVSPGTSFDLRIKVAFFVEDWALSRPKPYFEKGYSFSFTAG